MRKTDGMNHFDMKVVGDFNLNLWSSFLLCPTSSFFQYKYHALSFFPPLMAGFAHGTIAQCILTYCILCSIVHIPSWSTLPNQYDVCLLTLVCLGILSRIRSCLKDYRDHLSSFSLVGLGFTYTLGSPSAWWRGRKVGLRFNSGFLSPCYAETDLPLFVPSWFPLLIGSFVNTLLGTSILNHIYAQTEVNALKTLLSWPHVLDLVQLDEFLCCSRA